MKCGCTNVACSLRNRDMACVQKQNLPNTCGVGKCVLLRLKTRVEFSGHDFKRVVWRKHISKTTSYLQLSDFSISLCRLACSFGSPCPLCSHTLPQNVSSIETCLELSNRNDNQFFFQFILKYAKEMGTKHAFKKNT